MEFDQTALIKYRIEKAKETIRAAQLLLDNNLLSHAENRIYYSIFYIVSALAMQYNFSTSKLSNEIKSLISRNRWNRVIVKRGEIL